jgi:hypothetical protein
MEPIQLLGSAMGLAFISGIRLYATVFAVGIGIRLGLIHLDPALAGLEILSHGPVLVVAGCFYVAEFFADKIPWIDSVWDVLHTFIRPLGAAIIGAIALGDIDPTAKLVAVLVCGGVALSSHSAKAGTRLIVNHSPEPFTNIGLSCLEDGLDVAGVWLSLTHPTVMLAIVAVFIVVVIYFGPRVYRRAKATLISIYRWVSAKLGRANTLPQSEELTSESR